LSESEENYPFQLINSLLLKGNYSHHQNEEKMFEPKFFCLNDVKNGEVGVSYGKFKRRYTNRNTYPKTSKPPSYTTHATHLIHPTHLTYQTNPEKIDRPKLSTKPQQIFSGPAFIFANSRKPSGELKFHVPFSKPHYYKGNFLFDTSDTLENGSEALCTSRRRFSHVKSLPNIINMYFTVINTPILEQKIEIEECR
jgi:hypothetical protein